MQSKIQLRGRARESQRLAETSRGMAKRGERKFADGEITFREEDLCDAAYALIDGNVELIKMGPTGPVILAILRPGEMFGEMGIIDGSARSATARAIGEVTVRVIPAREFLRTLHEEPEAALSVVGYLIERLRGANNLLVQGGQGRDIERADLAGGAGAAKARPQGVIDRLVALSKEPRRETLQIRLAALPGDADGRRGKRLLAAFSGISGVKARALRETVLPDASADVIQQSLHTAAAGRRLLVERNADLLIWGEFDESGGFYSLRFLSRQAEDEDRIGWFGNMLRLTLPGDFSTLLDIVPAATAVAAVLPMSEGKAMTLRLAQPSALEAVMALPAEAGADLTRTERASLHACLGNVAAAAALRTGNDALRTAADHYKAALDGLTRKDTLFDWAIVQRNRAMALHQLGEREGLSEALDGAIDGYRAALQVFSREAFPRLWAGMQNRLGMALNRLDLKSGDVELVKHALSAFQPALQVYTRAETPLRWAEVMNNIGQSLQMLGGEARSVEALERAVESCKAAIEVRTRDQVLLLWAASQNSLGSALFLLGKLTRDVGHLEASAAAFRGAGDVYAGQGAGRMVSVTARNLAHAERLIDSLAPRGVPKLWWEDTGPRST